MTDCLNVSSLEFSYGTTKALNGVSLRVESGRFVALLGANGAGKTTLFSIVTGLYSARAGSVSIMGHMFFASSALYPLWKMLESSVALHWICKLNPFTWAVELIRYSLYGKFNWLALLVVIVCTVLFLGAAVIGYDPLRGFLSRKQGGVAAK